MEDVVYSNFYNEVLSTHDGLTKDQILGLIPQFLKEYQFNTLPLVHLNKKFYIGKLSIQFNNNVDKNYRGLIFPLDFWPELNKLTKPEQDELLALRDLANLAVMNTINYLKTVKYTGKYLELFNNILKDLAIQSGIDFNKYNTIIKYHFKSEVGSTLRVNHFKYIDLSKLASQTDLDSATLISYKKELKILS